MTKQIETKQECSLLETYCNNCVHCILNKDDKGNDVFKGILFKGEKLLFSEVDNLPHLKQIFNMFNQLSGGLDVDATTRFLIHFASSFIAGTFEGNLNYLMSFLQDMKPKDPIEARLLAQHLLLVDIGNQLLRNGNKQDMVFQADFYYKNAIKVLNLSQQTIHTLTKYKAKGTQQINIVHMHDNSKAIMAGEIGGRGKA